MFAPIYTKAGTNPDTVTSPVANWRKIRILIQNSDWSIALGWWGDFATADPAKSEPTLCMRWNRFSGEKGFPMARGFATWFVLPTKISQLYLSGGIFSDEVQALIHKVPKWQSTVDREEAADANMTNMGLDPYEALSPRENWTLSEVLYQNAYWSMACGTWQWPGQKPEPVLALRWNGETDAQGEVYKGSPNVGSAPAWFVIPSEHNTLFLNSPFLLPEKKARMAAFLQEEACVA